MVADKHCAHCMDVDAIFARSVAEYTPCGIRAANKLNAGPPPLTMPMLLSTSSLKYKVSLSVFMVLPLTGMSTFMIRMADVFVKVVDKGIVKDELLVSSVFLIRDEMSMRLP